MIEIDGSIGYGQVLRTALAISTLTSKPIKIFNIRKNRPKPGLMPQHLIGILELAKITKAKVKGAKIGSTEIIFIPKILEIPEKFLIDIKTAGSITLLLQTLLPVLIFSNKKIELTIYGGTDVKGSPTIIYYQKVFLYWLKKIGIKIEIDVLKHGFYPRGGGKVNVKVYPSKEILPIIALERGELKGIESYSIASKELEKAKVAERQIFGLESIVSKTFSNLKYVETLNPGSSLLATINYENCILGYDNVGERGKKAEIVGEEVGQMVKKGIKSNFCLDKFMSDQILLFASLANGTSEFTIEEFTDHVNTNISICEKLLNVKFEKNKNTIKIKGINFNLNI
ncbi:MAG: RNA 3'-terminal phosphate cyclase [Candidatus Aenigmatarchaeota archaeon]